MSFEDKSEAITRKTPGNEVERQAEESFRSQLFQDQNPTNQQRRAEKSEIAETPKQEDGPSGKIGEGPKEKDPPKDKPQSPKSNNSEGSSDALIFTDPYDSI